MRGIRLTIVWIRGKIAPGRSAFEIVHPRGAGATGVTLLVMSWGVILRISEDGSKMVSHGLSGEILSCVTKIQSNLETVRRILSKLDDLDWDQLDKDRARELLIKIRTEITELIEPPGEIARTLEQVSHVASRLSGKADGGADAGHAGK